MSTPAVSAVLRERESGAAYAGLVLTARYRYVYFTAVTLTVLEHVLF